MSENSRVWFITGASQGIGRSLLDAVLAAGDRAVATLRRPEVLAEYKDKYPASQLLIQRLDVTSVEEIDAAFAQVKEHFGRLDVVVNNAGYGLVAEIEGTPEDEARRCFETCFWGPFHICQRAVPFMRDVNPPGVGGRILNVSSCGGYASNQTLSIYNGAKFALEGMTESLRKEMDPSWNITAVIVQPGGFRTAWGGDSLKVFPSPPAYAAPDSPCAAFRAMSFGGGPSRAIGDPRKAGAALMRIAGMPAPPLRVQLGSESMAIVKAKAKETLVNAEKHADIAHSTNFDDVDKDAVLKMFEMYLAKSD
ncbi:NAD(P)-dependent dehydrogenase [Phanerochaete sordida]|uniref:NAD(P)-dependent dehydrogenase n=1 Tax=Phanerochaete sordida TaxID=48140 RepID=A0A9P3GTN0_9APHY|nr:NAD(P)-dependent dehydrogenase [Phanerochaete sordida]